MPRVLLKRLSQNLCIEEAEHFEYFKLLFFIYFNIYLSLLGNLNVINNVWQAALEERFLFESF